MKTASPIPANLDNLHAGEEELRARTTEWIRATPALADHLDLMERAMDLLDMLRQHNGGTEDDRVIAQLGMRCFNTFAASWKLCASGYYQGAAALLRDLIETSELVDYFHGAPEQVAVWCKADRKQLLNDFGPSVVRKALDARTGLGKSKREDIYRKFCTLAAHPSVNGFAMLRPSGSTAAVIGPFADITVLRAVLEEAGMLAARVGFVFLQYLDTDNTLCSSIAHRFMADAMDYSGKYLGKKYSPDERAELDRLFSGTL